MNKKPKNPPYIDNKKFLEEIIKYKAKVKDAEANGKQKPRISDYLGDCLQKIANKMSFRPEFIGYSFREEMISDALENCLLYFDNFNPEIRGPRSGIITPFGYFSQVIYYAFQRRISKEEKERMVKCRVMQNMFISVDDHLLEEYGVKSNARFADSINDFVVKYEKREAAKKLKREEKKRAKKEADNGIV